VKKESGSNLFSDMNNDWDTDKFIAAHLTASVNSIHICGYVNTKNEGDEDGTPPTNHWAAFLELPKDASVRLDMMPGYGSDGLRGKIEISSKKYVSTQNAIKTVTFSTIGTPTVQTITDLITRNGREKYTFTEEEEGCRYWIYTIISDLAASGIVPSDSGQAAWGAVSQYWRHPSGSEPRNVQRGTFR
jgi:hypothetical protein